MLKMGKQIFAILCWKICLSKHMYHFEYKVLTYIRLFVQSEKSSGLIRILTIHLFQQLFCDSQPIKKVR